MRANDKGQEPERMQAEMNVLKGIARWLGKLLRRAWQEEVRRENAPEEVAGENKREEEGKPKDLALPRELDPAIELLCEELLRKGRFHPAWEELGIRVFLTVLKEAAPIVFRKGEEAIAPLQWFHRFLEHLPPLVPLGEAAGEESEPQAGSRSASGAPLDGRSVALHRRALRMQAGQDGLDYAEALRRAAQ